MWTCQRKREWQFGVKEDMNDYVMSNKVWMTMWCQRKCEWLCSVKESVIDYCMWRQRRHEVPCGVKEDNNDYVVTMKTWMTILSQKDTKYHGVSKKTCTSRKNAWPCLKLKRTHRKCEHFNEANLKKKMPHVVNVKVKFVNFFLDNGHYISMISGVGLNIEKTTTVQYLYNIEYNIC